MGSDAAVRAALVDEVMRRTGVCWLRYAGSQRARPAWHLWRDGAAYVVSGDGEQPLPGIERAAEATVVTRTKDSRERLLAWRAHVAQVSTTDDGYDDIVAALIAVRLNHGDPAQVRRAWATGCTITRLTPTGVLDEDPAAMPDDDHAAAPPLTPAITRSRLLPMQPERQTRRHDLG
ncbi:MAG TPA: hypothetical protein VGP51_07915 [Nocardioidaceae bacterium]|nr:hypothetical protein [Nocardioidaceae bacterium]